MPCAQGLSVGWIEGRAAILKLNDVVSEHAWLLPAAATDLASATCSGDYASTPASELRCRIDRVCCLGRQTSAACVGRSDGWAQIAECQQKPSETQNVRER